MSIAFTTTGLHDPTRNQLRNALVGNHRRIWEVDGRARAANSAPGYAIEEARQLEFARRWTDLVRYLDLKLE